MSKSIVKYYLRKIYAYFDSFWVMKFDGIHPRVLSNKTLCSVGNWRIDDEEAIGNVQMDANFQKAIHFISLIK